MAGRLAYVPAEPEEISRPQLVKRCRTASKQGGYPDGELLLRHTVYNEAGINRPLRHKEERFSSNRPDLSHHQGADRSGASIDLDPRSQGLEVCKALIWAFSLCALLTGLIVAGVYLH